MDDFATVKEDFLQLVRLAVAGRQDDVRLYVARLVRKYRIGQPDIAVKLETLLRGKAPTPATILRHATVQPDSDLRLPIDEESKLSLLRHAPDNGDIQPPILAPEQEETFRLIIDEHSQSERLASLGLRPSRTAIFTGPPGVGKSMTARWLASQLGLPFYSLDLAAIMSSLLGKSGANIRAAMDYAKREPCVLLLDEVDAVAKRRSDDSDVGELKRLVTVILQEVDDWPTSGLLLAATNHPELVDPALWRRFDVISEFVLPSGGAIRDALGRFLDKDRETFAGWIDFLCICLAGNSFSDIEREIYKMRRIYALSNYSPFEVIEHVFSSKISSLSKDDKIRIAAELELSGSATQTTIAKITGLSRDTIRKYSKLESISPKLAKSRIPA